VEPRSTHDPWPMTATATRRVGVRARVRARHSDSFVCVVATGKGSGCAGLRLEKRVYGRVVRLTDRCPTRTAAGNQVTPLPHTRPRPGSMTASPPQLPASTTTSSTTTSSTTTSTPRQHKHHHRSCHVAPSPSCPTGAYLPLHPARRLGLRSLARST
jgi:hypothetical protein